VILLIRQKQTFSVKKFGNFSGFDRTNWKIGEKGTKKIGLAFTFYQMLMH